jgi:hypothetical protein
MRTILTIQHTLALNRVVKESGLQISDFDRKLLRLFKHEKLVKQLNPSYCASFTIVPGKWRSAVETIGGWRSGTLCNAWDLIEFGTEMPPARFDVAAGGAIVSWLGIEHILCLTSGEDGLTKLKFRTFRPEIGHATLPSLWLLIKHYEGKSELIDLPESGCGG